MTRLAYKHRIRKLGNTVAFRVKDRQAFEEAKYLLDAKITDAVYLSTHRSKVFWIMTKGMQNNYLLKGGLKNIQPRSKTFHKL